MGHTFTTVEMQALDQQIPGYIAECMVDTRAVDCMAPASALHAAGIGIEGFRTYELADGSVVKYAYGFARIRFMGEETVAQVAFGPDTCEPILGVVALENTGFMVDPRTKRLRHQATLPMKQTQHHLTASTASP